MKRERHPEYIQSLRDRETVARCRAAVEGWEAGGLELAVPAYGLTWTPAGALALVRELQELFATYNRVLWEQFPYCRACGGGCCVNEASHMGPFDGVALALLDASLLELPADLGLTDRDCIYLAGQACSLPAEWRTLKCWSFFCLGGLWNPELPLGERYGDLTAALKTVVLAHLPAALRSYEQVRGERLVDHLHDPADFAAALEDALWEVLVGPLHARYPLLDQDAPGARPADTEAGTDEILTFIVEAMEQVLVDAPVAPEGMPVTAADLLEDLETLEWIVVGRPANASAQLREMALRYAGAPSPIDGERPSIWYQMHARIEQLLDTR